MVGCSNLTYKLETRILESGAFMQTLMQEGNGQTEIISNWVCQTRDIQVKEALAKLGFMHWESTKESQPEEYERCLFLVGEYPDDKEYSYGYRIENMYFDLSDQLLGEPAETSAELVTWWCRISHPNNNLQLTPGAGR